MSRPKPHGASPLARAGVILLFALTGAAAIVGPYWYFKIRPRLKRLENPHWGSNPSRPHTVEPRADNLKAFDLVLDLPGDPLGIAWNGDEAIVGNRQKPWGFMRLRRDGKTFKIEKVQVIEPAYKQTMSFWGVTWNGTHYVGYTSGDWFQQKDTDVFTIHDPKTLRVLKWKQAPPDLGCLAWDGSHYWASTRKNTEETPEPTFLWKLDREFNVVAKYEPPAIGCQGLAWDGAHLWFVDVFSDAMYLLDVSGEKPEVVHTEYVELSYLSGAGFDGRNVWISEYDDNRMHRVKPLLRLAWKGGVDLSEAHVASVVTTTASEADIEELQRKLRSDDWSDRMHAGNRLRELGLPITFDREQDNFAKREPEETEVFDWSAEIRGDSLYASWHLYFDHLLFDQEESDSNIVSIPKFARYEITVEGGTLDEPVKREFTATPGDILKNDVRLVSGLGPGEYDVSLFIHVQYRTPAGTDRILNRSAMTLHVER